MGMEKLLQRFGKTAKETLLREIHFDASMERRILTKLATPHKRHDRAVTVTSCLAACAVMGIALWSPWVVSETRTTPAIQVNAPPLPTSEPPAQASTRNIPAFSWPHGDQGFEHAFAEGEGMTEPVVVEKDGYTIKIMEVMLDLERITFAVTISGEKIREQYAKREESDGEIEWNVDPSGLGSLTTQYDSWQKDEGEPVFYLYGDGLLEPDLVRKMSTKANPAIRFEISRGRESFLNVDVPIQQEWMKEAVTHQMNQSLSLDAETNGMIHQIDVKQLRLLPTAMSLDLQLNQKDGYTVDNLENAYITDESGNKYGQVQGTMGKRALDSTTTRFYFVPSLYHKPLPKQLTLHFSGLRMTAVHTEEKLQLQMNQAFPQYEQFDGQEYAILGATFKDNNLELVIKGKQWLQRVNFSMKGGERGKREVTTQGGVSTVTIRFPVEQKDMYEIELKRYDYLVHAKGVIPLDR